MKKHVLLFLMSFMLALSMNAQNVTGKVVGSEDNSPLPGVSVVVKGTAKGTVTDLDGLFTIEASSKDVLVFSFVGFDSQQVPVGDSKQITVTLQTSANLIETYVVTGYGASVKKKESTGANSNVLGKEIENLPMQSFDRAMQGRMAGVQINSANGVPGGAVQVRIRGVGSISAGNDPLYVVDGVPLNNRGDGGGNVNTNPLAFLNPNDIESIDVLKDPATAAIYGAQAANGVVLITTKSGKAGKGKTTVTLNAYKGNTEPIRVLGTMNTQQFIDARIEAIKNVTTNPVLATIKGDVLAAIGYKRDLSDAEIAALPTYNWQDAVYKQGTADNYDISVKGGDANSNFYASASYNKQDAALINIDFKRYAGRLSVNHKINDKFRFETGINLSTFTQRGPYGDPDGTTAFGAPQYSAPVILPFNPIYNADGTYYGLPGSGTTLVGDLSHNVVATSNYIRANGTTNQVVGNLTLFYNITKNLFVRGLVGMDFRNVKSSFFGDPRLNDYYNSRGIYNQANNTNSNKTANVTINYSKEFKKHTIGGLLGTEYRDEVWQGESFNAAGFPSPEFTTANAAAEPSSVSGFWTGVKRAGAFSNLRYGFANRYLFNFIVRYDGSSRFGANNKWGVFPSVSTKWNISEETFLKNSKVVSDLGLRLSWGTTGNDNIDNFASRRLYGLGGVYQGNSGIRPTSLGNPDLKWERNQTLNIGLDYGLFKGKIKGAVEVYERTSKDLLLSRSLPTSNGFSSILENVGEVQNRGFEFEITTTNFSRKNFTWETSFNISLQKNKVTKLAAGDTVLPGDLSIRVGYPLFTNVNVPYAGVNPANGRPMWYDLGNNPIYLVRAADQRPLGHSQLPWGFGGVTNKFTFVGFELDVFFQYDLGRVMPNTQEFRLADNGAVLRNSLTYYWDNRWTTPGQITDVPKPANNRTEISGRVASYQSLSRFYQDGSYIRLKNISLSYNLPAPLLQKLHFKSLKLYAQAMNIKTWTKWTGFDPEFVNLNGNNNQGVIPLARNYTFGLQLGL
ncbi:MAG: TonB-dependent receptor [Saprospiraceae bacterium]|nr:TonB-dependent receptor [Saprospiraceae bacterium]